MYAGPQGRAITKGFRRPMPLRGRATRPNFPLTMAGEMGIKPQDNSVLLNIWDAANGAMRSQLPFHSF